LLVGALLMLAACSDEESDPESESDAGNTHDAGGGDAGDDSDGGDHGSHQSPGCSAGLVGATSSSLDASAYIWDFFERHPLP
jgi:hypothetical protein